VSYVKIASVFRKMSGNRPLAPRSGAEGGFPSRIPKRRSSVSRWSAVERAAVDSRRVERVYSILSRVYDDAFDWALGPGRAEAVGRLPIRPDDRVLEVGVGTGLSLPSYPAGCRVTGIDISEPMLDQARQRAEVLEGLDLELRQMDAREIAFASATFDHVLAPYVISVVPEPQKVMAEIARVCRPGGTVIVVNHFHHPRQPLRLFEKALTPASQWVGFRLDVPMGVVTCTPGLRQIGVVPVNFFGWWKVVVMRREAPHAA
jgi:phosphatidylethanolamine/phosphatidyl-N-methylethanolamine N-methyltransferase